MVPSKLKSTLTQSTHIYARNRFEYLKRLIADLTSQAKNGPISHLFLTKRKKTSYAGDEIKGKK
jgi:hypothetical protein